MRCAAWRANSALRLGFHANGSALHVADGVPPNRIAWQPPAIAAGASQSRAPSNGSSEGGFRLQDVVTINVAGNLFHRLTCRVGQYLI